jgi:RNA polymerase sigma factor (sigma-70 family)
MAPAPSSQPEDIFPVMSEEAYGRFYADSWQKVLSWTIRHYWDILKDDLTADQVVQDAFSRVFERREMIRKRPVAVVINEVKDLLKKHRIREVPMGSLGLRSSDTRLGGNIPDPKTSTPSSVVGRTELDEIFRKEGIEKLRPEFRQPVELSLAGKQYSQIAGIMGISEAAVQKRIATAREHILKCMVKYYPDIAESFPGSIDPIRTYQGAREAVARLPVACVGIVTLVYVQKFPLEEIWSEAGYGSLEDARLYLEEGLHILEVLHNQKMPLALVRSLERY